VIGLREREREIWLGNEAEGERLEEMNEKWRREREYCGEEKGCYDVFILPSSFYVFVPQFSVYNYCDTHCICTVSFFSFLLTQVHFFSLIMVLI